MEEVQRAAARCVVARCPAALPGEGVIDSALAHTLEGSALVAALMQLGGWELRWYSVWVRDSPYYWREWRLFWVQRQLRQQAATAAAVRALLPRGFLARTPQVPSTPAVQSGLIDDINNSAYVMEGRRLLAEHGPGGVAISSKANRVGRTRIDEATDALRAEGCGSVSLQVPTERLWEVAGNPHEPKEVQALARARQQQVVYLKRAGQPVPAMHFVPHCRPFNGEEDEHYLQVFDLIAHVPYHRDPEPGRSLEDGLALVVKTFCPSAFEATGVYLWEGGTGAEVEEAAAEAEEKLGCCYNDGLAINHCRCALCMKAQHSSSGEPWTEAETDRLRALVPLSDSIASAAAWMLGRNAAQCTARLVLLARWRLARLGQPRVRQPPVRQQRAPPAAGDGFEPLDPARVAAWELAGGKGVVWETFYKAWYAYISYGAKKSVFLGSSHTREEAIARYFLAEDRIVVGRHPRTGVFVPPAERPQSVGRLANSRLIGARVETFSDAALGERATVLAAKVYDGMLKIDEVAGVRPRLVKKKDTGKWRANMGYNGETQRLGRQTADLAEAIRYRLLGEKAALLPDENPEDYVAARMTRGRERVYGRDVR